MSKRKFIIIVPKPPKDNQIIVEKPVEKGERQDDKTGTSSTGARSEDVEN